MIIYAKNAHSLAKKIRDIRIKHNISQTKLATYAGTTINTILRWETGKNVPNIDVLIKVMKELGVIIGEEITITVKKKTPVTVADSEEKI